MIHHTTVIINNLGSVGLTFPAAYFGKETEIHNMSSSGTIYFNNTVGVSDTNYEFALLSNEKISLGTMPRNDLYAIGSLPSIELGIFSGNVEPIG